MKINYESTKRPHYFAFKDDTTGLYWLVPCSSKVEKFERLIKRKHEQHKPTDTIKIVKIFDRKTVLLFQDMFLNLYQSGIRIFGFIKDYEKDPQDRITCPADFCVVRLITRFFG